MNKSENIDIPVEEELETDREVQTKLEDRRHDFAIILEQKCSKDLIAAIIKDLDSHGFDAMLSKCRVNGRSKWRLPKLFNLDMLYYS